MKFILHRFICIRKVLSWRLGWTWSHSWITTTLLSDLRCQQVVARPVAKQKVAGPNNTFIQVGYFLWRRRQQYNSTTRNHRHGNRSNDFVDGMSQEPSQDIFMALGTHHYGEDTGNGVCTANKIELWQIVERYRDPWHFTRWPDRSIWEVTSWPTKGSLSMLDGHRWLGFDESLLVAFQTRQLCWGVEFGEASHFSGWLEVSKISKWKSGRNLVDLYHSTMKATWKAAKRLKVHWIKRQGSYTHEWRMHHAKKALSQSCLGGSTGSVTLPKTNIEPENRPLEKELPIGNHHFQVLC